MDDKKNKTCFFTGHRVIPKKDSSNLLVTLDEKIRELIADGCENFVCGGAVGFDTLAACRVIVAKKYFTHMSKNFRTW